MTALLSIKACTIRFGGLVAVKDLNLEVHPGELFGLIGPNGAGKTTIFNLITGLYRPTSGTISFNGKEIQGLKAHTIASAGIARTFQNIRLFSNLSVIDNVMVSCHMKSSQGVFGAIFRGAQFQQEEKAFRQEAMGLLKIFQLENSAEELACNLPYGSQRRLEMVRALVMRPKLILLDEPAAGMNPHEAAELMALIRRMRDEYHLAILLVEHNMKVVMGVCERVQVIDHGESIAVGAPAEIRRHPQVIAAYLGSDDAEK